MRQVGTWALAGLFCVLAHDASAQIGPRAKFPGGPAPAPPPPALRVVSATSTTISLSWDALPDAAGYGYAVFHGTTAQGPFRLASKAEKVGTTDRGLVPDYLFYYRIQTLTKEAAGSSAVPALDMNAPAIVGSARTLPSAAPQPAWDCPAATPNDCRLYWPAIPGAAAYELIPQMPSYQDAIVLLGCFDDQSKTQRLTGPELRTIRTAAESVCPKRSVRAIFLTDIPTPPVAPLYGAHLFAYGPVAVVPQ